MSHGHPIHELVEAALAALAAHLPPPSDVEAVELVLEQVGDALRAGLPLPSEIARWIARAPLDVLGAVAERWRARLSDAALPGWEDEAEMLGAAATLRDRSESVWVGLRRACVGSGRALEEVPGADALRSAQASYDERLAEHASRARVEEALGIRRALLTGASWTGRLRDGEGDEGAGAPPAIEGASSPSRSDASPSDAAPSDAAPSDATVAAYVSRGAHASWVEGFAARAVGFAEELAETIAALRDAAEPVSLAARRWEARFARAPRVRWGLALREAAADDASAPRSSVELGILAPTEAEARLVVEGGRVTLRVLAEPATLRAVTLGAVHAREAAPGVWEVTRAFSDAPMALAVEDTSGRRFEVELELHRGSDPS